MIEPYQAELSATWQGFTKLLAVSGSTRPLIPTVSPGWSDLGLAFDVAVHVGAPCAIVFHFRADLLRRADRWLRSLAGEPGGDESRHQLGSLL